MSQTQRLGGRARQRRNAAILAESDICHMCGQPGSDSVDHIYPVSRAAALGIDHEHRSNLLPAHHDVPPFCNRRKSDLLPSEIDRRVLLVCGPPGAGKTTYAHQVAEADGLEVYDLDDQQWQGSDPLFRAALVRVREQSRARAVVIRSAATLTARQAAANNCGATDCVVLDTSLDVCINRIRERGRETPPLRVQIKAARDWWGTYQPGPVKLSFASLRLRTSGTLD